MRGSHNLQRTWFAVLEVIGTVALVTLSTYLGGQVTKSRPQSNPHDFRLQVTLFGNYGNDFAEMGKELRGPEQETAVMLQNTAVTAEGFYYAVNVMLQIYDGIECEADKARARPVLEKALNLYSSQVEREGNNAAGTITLAKTPALVQSALRMKDDLRAAREKLDALSFNPD